MLDKVKIRCGIISDITIYDQEIKDYIEDGKSDMIASGVPGYLIEREDERIVTAITCYVKAYLGNDRSDTEKYLKLYREKVFRLTLEEEDPDVEWMH